MPARMTAAQKKRYADLYRSYTDVALSFSDPDVVAAFLPHEWSEIPADPIPDKVRVTLRLDADVAKFFRTMGRGHQRTMNLVLRSFMLARLTEVVAQAQPVETLPLSDEEKVIAEAEISLQKQLDILRRRRMGIGIELDGVAAKPGASGA